MPVKDAAWLKANCPNRAAHEDEPTEYMIRAEWARNKLKTHRQVKCEGCGLYVIWVPR